jgi:hypothetical protein
MNTPTKTPTTSTKTQKIYCICGDVVPPRRAALGYRLCLPCGESLAVKTRVSWCVVPMNKSNYVLVTDPTILRQLNPKRTT